MKSNFEELVDQGVKIKLDPNASDELKLAVMCTSHIDLRLHTLTWTVIYIAAVLTAILVVILAR